MKLSIIIPVYNERATIVALIDRLNQSGCDKYQWIFVDDGSTDGTTELLRQHIPAGQTLIVQPKNQGKFFAVRTGLANATGDWVIVQDADLEYDPAEIPKLLQKAEASSVQPVAVYGRRPSCWERPSRWIFASGVLGIDVAMLFVYRAWVRDHATCYKLVPRRVLDAFQLESTGFEGCVEITAKLMHSKIPILQVPIRYEPRGIAEGKKLSICYGWSAMRAVIRFRKARGSQ